MCQFPYRETSLFYGYEKFKRKERRVCQFPYRETSLFYGYVVGNDNANTYAVSIPLSGNFSFLLSLTLIPAETMQSVNSLIGKLLFSTVANKGNW